MKKFNEWLIKENYPYNPNIDGPPLKPQTISGAEVQIRTLAYEIRTSLGLDPEFAKYHDHIRRCMEHLEQAANELGVNMSGEERNRKHRYIPDVPTS